MGTDPAPRVLTPAQATVETVCTAFGWDYRLKAGHAATFAKRLRTKLGLELTEFMQMFTVHYGRRDPGAGEWWVYREQYPCKGAGAFPSPKIVTDTWGRWELPIGIIRGKGSMGGILEYIEELEHGDSDRS